MTDDYICELVKENCTAFRYVVPWEVTARIVIYSFIAERRIKEEQYRRLIDMIKKDPIKYRP